MSTELRLRKRGYVAGDTIPFYAEIENNSCKKLNARVALVQVRSIYTVNTNRCFTDNVSYK